MTISKCLKKKKPASSTISFLLCCLIKINIFYFLQKNVKDRKDEGNTEEENNGYVVFELNIHGSGGKWGEVRGETLFRPPPPLAGFWTDK